MTTPPGIPLPNQSLIAAAFAGLLCLSGCSAKEEAARGAGAAGEPAGSTGGTTSMGASGGGSGGGSGAGTEAGAGGVAGEVAGASSLGGATDSAGAGGYDASMAGAGANDSAGAGVANAAGAGGAPPDPPHITSSKDAGVLAEADFKALCDERGGTVEVMPHCGGFATAKGFSYDNGTLLLSEHTCAGANTCGGWNCVIE
jgi:hypothetical protein